MRILMIEDNIDISRVIERTVETVLEDEDASVEVASSLGAADQCLSECVYDLIVMDASLPDGNGLQWLRYQPRVTSQQVPVIVLSAYCEVDSIVEAQSVGTACILKKSMANLADFSDLIEESIYNRYSTEPEFSHQVARLG